MKFTSLLLGSLAFAAVVEKQRTQTEEEYWKLWQEFLPTRHYGAIKDNLEHGKRFGIFKDAVDLITRHNAEDHTWTMGINKFADMTPEEFKKDVIGTECKENFKKLQAENVAARKTALKNPPVNNPSSIDWAASGKVTAVKDQGNCGSCWSFSTTGCVESRYAIKHSSSPTSLSEQELVDCTTAYPYYDGGCNGGSMISGIQYVADKQGLALESQYTYTATDGTCHSSSYTHYDPVNSYTIVTAYESYLETAVAAGPVSVAIEADETAFQYYQSGVLTGSCGTQLDHGVLAVGYGTDSGTAYWKVKNSWGGNWGESGYIRICKGCGANGDSGECGINEGAVYANA